MQNKYNLPGFKTISDCRFQTYMWSTNCATVAEYFHCFSSSSQAQNVNLLPIPFLSNKQFEKKQLKIETLSTNGT